MKHSTAAARVRRMRDSFCMQRPIVSVDRIRRIWCALGSPGIPRIDPKDDHPREASSRIPRPHRCHFYAATVAGQPADRVRAAAADEFHGRR